MSSENILLRPKKGTTSISIPVTFDYNGGTKEYKRTKIVWAVLVSLISIVLGIGFIIRAESILLKLSLCFATLFIGSILVRFVILKEHKVRNTMADLIESQGKREVTDFWSSYTVEDTYPYYVHLPGNRKAMFIQYEKDVIVGKERDAEFNHYEAIGDALNLLGFVDTIYHIDYMDTVGSDDRLDYCFQHINTFENEGLKKLLVDIFTNLSFQMEENVTTYDVYAYTFTCSESTFQYNIQSVIACMLDANYCRYKILNANSHRGLVQAIFNLEDFSVQQAEISSSPKSKGVTPISLYEAHTGKETIVNKTKEEKAQELKLTQQQEVLKKEERKRRKSKRGKKNKNDDEDLNIF